MAGSHEHEQIREPATAYDPGLERPAPLGKMTFEEFVDWCDEDTWAEWVAGEVIVLSPASTVHQKVSAFLNSFLWNYVLLKKLGLVLSAPFLVRLPEPVGHGREPDLIFIKKGNPGRLEATYFAGAPDLVVEITSPESLARDRGEKFIEYEAAGVQEYWLIDPDRQQAEFYRLEAGGRYRLALAGAAGKYQSRVIPGLWLEIEWLWQDPPLPVTEALQQVGIV